MNAYKAREPRVANENCCAKSIMEDITKWSPLRCNACIKTDLYTPLHTIAIKSIRHVGLLQSMYIHRWQLTEWL